jgi:endonuclease YncB( thermonuclease family)
MSFRCAIFLATLLGATAAWWGASILAQPADLPADLNGIVVRITDGDTLTLLTDQQDQITVRLTEIDTPESGQAWGTSSKEALSALVFSQRVRVVDNGQDQYGRTLGRIYKGDLDVSAEMIRSGSAWAYRAYLTDQSFLVIEEEARTARRGLWSMPYNQIIAPWDYRRGVRTPAALNVPTPSGALQCGAKRYCQEMSSCAEARFYLNMCGLGRLDGDGDGVPCENICR